MSYRLDLALPLADTLDTTACEQIDRALDDLSDTDSIAAGAHDARKCCKKLRALVRLVRPALKDSLYKRENKAYRDISRTLAPIRDAEVFGETLADLQESTHLADSHALRPLHTYLQERAQAIVRQSLHDGAIEHAIDELTAARQRREEWTRAKLKPEDLLAGIRKIYRQGYKRCAQAQDDPTAERLHEWRKGVKYLWYQTRLLEHLWPDLMRATAELQHELSSLLGSDHDLAEFQALVRKEPQVCPDDDLRRELVQATRARRNHLQERIWPTAARIYAEAPDQYEERLQNYCAATAAEPD